MPSDESEPASPAIPENKRDRALRPIDNKSTVDRSAKGTGQRPEHPNGAAALLMIGVVLLLFLIAAFSAFGGR